MIYSRGSKLSARIERWVLRLQPYGYKVCCVPSRDNDADALSRLTMFPTSEKYRYDDEHVRMVALKAVPVAMNRGGARGARPTPLILGKNRRND